MLIAVLDDYQDAVRSLMCVQPLLLQGHSLRVFTDTEKDLDRLAARGLLYNRFHTTAICSPTW